MFFLGKDPHACSRAPQNYGLHEAPPGGLAGGPIQPRVTPDLTPGPAFLTLDDHRRAFILLILFFMICSYDHLIL